MNWRCLRKSSRSSCLKVTRVFSVEIQPVWSCWFWASVFLCAAEMSIIEEYEKNQLFEQQYISSVVEGMDEMRIICPICHTWVWKSIALNTWQQQLVVSHFAISNWDLKRSTCLKMFSVRAVARTLSSLSQIWRPFHTECVMKHWHEIQNFWHAILSVNLSLLLNLTGTTWTSTASLSPAPVEFISTLRFVCWTLIY